MKKIILLLSLAFFSSTAVVEQAHAIDIEDLDENATKKKNKKQKAKKSSSKADSSEVVREIVRGYNVKASAGMTAYLLKYGGGVLSGGTAIGLSFGGDFYDRENLSMSWELSFQQGVHNGAPWETQAGAIEPNRYIQGDTRTFSFLGSYEISAYPVRRIGLGFRVGAGLVLTPLLMVRDHYETEVLGEWGVRPPVHETPHPVVFGGPTFEYYTKLSHFSIGVDVDASYAIGFDLGLTTTGYMKYTFGKSLGEKASK